MKLHELDQAHTHTHLGVASHLLMCREGHGGGCRTHTHKQAREMLALASWASGCISRMDTPHHVIAQHTAYRLTEHSVQRGNITLSLNVKITVGGP